ncbi:hypothetical protein V7S43_018643 [Phytophthora oleae]|uniref:Uncharacterized protein n=1 Tax=Phytophthora oleae TaxID=2107226 RepID=A0ABD3EQE3_9STRA
MDVSARSTTYFVSRFHEDTPASLKDLLRSSVKRDENKESVTSKCGEDQDFNAGAIDSDSEYECGHSGDSDDDIENSEPEVDEWRFHATEPREGLYLHEMRRQRGRMGEKEARWVRGYIKAQRAWKTRTGHSIDEFDIPAARQSKRCKLVRWDRSLELPACEQEVEGEEEGVVGTTRLETLLLLAAIVFICLSLGVQLFTSIKTEHNA